MAVGEDDGGIGMDLAVLQPRHAMIHAPRQLADLRMQRAAKGDVHLLEAAADAEDRDAARHARLRQRQGHGVAMLVVGLMPGVRLGLETGRMDVGAGARQQHAVDHIQQRADIGDIRRARKHQRQGTCNVRNRAKIPFPCCLNGESAFDAMRVGNHTDHGSRHRRSHLPVRKSRNASSSRPSASSRIGRGVAKLKRSQDLAARSKLRAGAGKDARAALDPGSDLLGRQAGPGKIDPREVGGSKPHRACAGRCGLDPRVEQIAALGEIGQQRVEPRVAGAPRRLGGDHAEAVVGAKAARHDPRVDTTLQRRIRGDACADMGAGQIEGLGRGDAGDETVCDLGRGDDGGRVLRAVKEQIAMDLVGNQDQVVLGTECGQRADLIDGPDGPTGIVRAAKENDLRPRRQLGAQRIEVHERSDHRSRPAAHRECAAHWRE